MPFRIHVHRIQLLEFPSRDTTADHRGPRSYYLISTAEKPRSCHRCIRSVRRLEFPDVHVPSLRLRRDHVHEPDPQRVANQGAHAIAADAYLRIPYFRPVVTPDHCSHATG